MTNPTPRLLGGRYELGELIGRGGMAEVHRGYDTRLGRPVAVKILRSDHARDAGFLQRFRREAQSVAGLNHRSIVAVYDSGEDHAVESGGAEVSIPYIVMELVEGRTLREILNERGRLEPGEAARIVEWVLDALAYSHQMGIIHRDIKPGNVMVGDDGSVKVMDFGIARAVADTQATMTQTAAVIGTAQYVSPEQARGETVDHRSDIYSAGCVLFELLTGTTPYTGEPISLTYQHVNAPIPLPSSLDPDIPRDLDAIVAAALTKDRDERYEDACDMADDLRHVRDGRPVGALAAAALATAIGGGAALAAGEETVAYAPAGPPSRSGDTTTFAAADDPDAPRDTRRRRGGWGWLVALLLLVPLLALGWLAYQQSQPDEVAQVTVPQLVGMDEDAAEAELTNLGLEPDPEEGNSDAPVGEVFEQEQTQGSVVDKGSRITYRVSLGPVEVQVPELVGLSRKDAEQAITDAGLKVGEVSTRDGDAEKNTVLDSQPGQYTSVAADSEIDLVVASGEVELPDVVGKDVEDVRRQLYDLGLELETSERVSDAPAGQILEQAPEAGTVEVGSTVRLVVARARDKTVTETTTSSPTTTTPSPTETSTSPDPTTTDEPDPTTTEPTSPQSTPPNTRSTTGQTP